MKNLIFAAFALAAATGAQANSFIDGDFSQNNGAGQFNYGTTVNGWYVPGGGLIALYADGTLDTVAAPSDRYQYGGLQMWGGKNGGNTVIPASPSGAWDIAMDGDYETEPLSQDITGLHVGKTYTVGFNYAYAQQQGYNGDTIQSISVDLGNSPSQSTPTLTNPSHDFTGWYATSFNFTATSAAETLSFLAHGNLPIPPFAVISGVTFTPDVAAVPEPATWAMMLVGVAGLGALARRRRSAAFAA